MWLGLLLNSENALRSLPTILWEYKTPNIVFPPLATSAPVFLRVRDDAENKGHEGNIGSIMKLQREVVPSLKLHFSKQNSKVLNCTLSAGFGNVCYVVAD